MTHSNSKNAGGLNDYRRPENGRTSEARLTEDGVKGTLGGVKFERIPDDEGEEIFARSFTEAFGIPFNSPVEANPSEVGQLSPVSATSGDGKPDPSITGSEQASAPELTRDQLKSLIISFLDQLAASPPPTSPGARMPSLETPSDVSPSKDDATATTSSLSQATNQSEPAARKLLPVPRGLFRCPVCNEYRGTIDIDDQSVHSLCKGDFLRVQCICDGILCRRCKINRIHRPISNVWDERGGLGHIPYLAAMASCNECRAKQQAEEAAAQEKRPASGTDKELLKEKSK